VKLKVKIDHYHIESQFNLTRQRLGLFLETNRYKGQKTERSFEYGSSLFWMPIWICNSIPIEVESKERQHLSIINPTKPCLHPGAFVLPKSLLRGEESSTLLAREFADLSVLRNFVSQSVMLSREFLQAA